MPTAKISGQAMMLQIAASKLWGEAAFEKLDPWTISMAHPDAVTAMLSGRSEITTHFCVAPFQYYELAQPGMRAILKSYDSVNGPHTNGVQITTQTNYKENPKVCASVFAVLGLAARTSHALDPCAPNEDTDGDGIANNLECSLWHTNPLLADTDGDGPTDAWELLGRRDGTPQLPLALWGADPRYKDIFVEVDVAPATANGPIESPGQAELRAAARCAWRRIPSALPACGCRSSRWWR